MAETPQIILFEPNEISRKLFLGLLSQKKYGVLAAADEKEAISFLTKSPVAAIVDIDGKPEAAFAFIDEARAQVAGMPFLLMAETENRKALEDRFQDGVPPVLAKPVSPDTLLKALESLSREIRPHGETGVPTQKQDFMRRALDLAVEKMNDGEGGPFAAVIVRGGKIIAEGWSRVFADQDPTAHAEIMAIRAACRKTGHHQLSGCEIYCSCEPCPMCLAALYWARIDRVYYAGMREDAAKAGFDDLMIADDLTLPEERRSLPCRMLLHDEARVIFESWQETQKRAIS